MEQPHPRREGAVIHVAPLSRDFSTGAEVFVVNRCSQAMNSRCRGNSTTGSITGSPALAWRGSYRYTQSEMKSAGLCAYRSRPAVSRRVSREPVLQLQTPVEFAGVVRRPFHGQCFV